MRKTKLKWNKKKCFKNLTLLALSIVAVVLIAWLFLSWIEVIAIHENGFDGSPVIYSKYNAFDLMVKLGKGLK